MYMNCLAVMAMADSSAAIQIVNLHHSLMDAAMPSQSFLELAPLSLPSYRPNRIPAGPEVSPVRGCRIVLVASFLVVRTISPRLLAPTSFAFHGLRIASPWPKRTRSPS